MNYNNGRDVWDWRGQVYSLEDSNTSIEAPQSLLNEVDENVDHISYMFDNETTPVKACSDLPYYVSNNESELYRDHSSQVKRRRVLQFESEVLETPLCNNNEELLRYKEKENSLEAAISDMSQWVAGFTDGISASSNNGLDPSSEGWITDCFNEAEMHLCNEDFTSACGASDVNIDVTEFCNTAPEYEAELVKSNNISTPRSVVFKGTKSYMRTPPKLASSVVYPFAFIKPCSVLGDTTLKDINQRIHNPPKPKPEEDDLTAYPTSAFSGKPVVGKTKIHTDGGKGSITIMRTRG